METAQEKELQITTQEELDSFLFNYEPSEKQIDIDVIQSGNFIFDSKGKDVSKVTVHISGEAKDSLADVIKIEFTTSPGHIRVYRRYTQVKVSPNKVSYDPYVYVNSAYCSLDLHSIRTVEIFDSRTIDLSINDCELEGGAKTKVLISGDSSVYICDDHQLKNAQVRLLNGSKLFIRSNFSIRDVNFYLCDRSQLEITKATYTSRVNLCAFDSSTFVVDSRYDMPLEDIQLFDNAHIVYRAIYYDNILDYCEKNNIEHTNTYGYFYKIVRKGENDKLTAPNYPDYEYKIGEYAYPKEGFDEIAEECASGIHCSDLNWALRYYGSTKNAIVLKLRVEFKDFAPYEAGRVPEKLRCKKAFVEKIVDPDTLGPRKMLLK